jgi:hypothetical protein
LITSHTQDEPQFIALARGYPETYVDISQTHWRDLTGDHD